MSAELITICHPVWQLGHGGLERQLLQLIRRLPQDRFRHILVVRGWDEACAAEVELLGTNVVVVRQPARGRERFWSLELASILRQYSVDVLHVRGLSMLIDSLVAARLCKGVKVAFSFHGFEQAATRFGPLRRRLYREAIARCDDRWAVSRSAAEAIAAEMLLSVSRFGVLVNGVDTELFVPANDRSARPVTKAAGPSVVRCGQLSCGRISGAGALPSSLAGRPAWPVPGRSRRGRLPHAVAVDYRLLCDAPRAAIRRRLGLPNDRLVVLSVGNLKSVKGHDVLLKAISELGPNAGRAALVLVGRDHLNGRLQSWSARRAGDCDIHFAGEQSDTLPWYQAADIFVLPSRWEGMSNALLEAMSCGLPAVATAVGGNQDVIEHGRTGLLVRPNQPGELCAAIRRLMADKSLRISLAGAARREVRERFSADAAAAEYARRYEALALLRDRRGKPARSRDQGSQARLEEQVEKAAP